MTIITDRKNAQNYGNKNKDPMGFIIYICEMDGICILNEGAFYFINKLKPLSPPIGMCVLKGL